MSPAELNMGNSWASPEATSGSRMEALAVGCFCVRLSEPYRFWIFRGTFSGLHPCLCSHAPPDLSICTSTARYSFPFSPSSLLPRPPVSPFLPRPPFPTRLHPIPSLLRGKAGRAAGASSAVASRHHMSSYVQARPHLIMNAVSPPSNFSNNDSPPRRRWIHAGVQQRVRNIRLDCVPSASELGQLCSQASSLSCSGLPIIRSCLATI
jgi:hypothetical protein